MSIVVMPLILSICESLEYPKPFQGPVSTVVLLQRRPGGTFGKPCGRTTCDESSIDFPDYCPDYVS